MQLRAITASFAAITGVDAEQAPWFVDVSAGVALVMMVFAILFGARKLSLSEKHPGLMDAVAFESVVKLVAFMLIGPILCLPTVRWFCRRLNRSGSKYSHARDSRG